MSYRGSRLCSPDAQSHRWIANKISEILGSEDDVVIELCFNLIEGPRHVCWIFLASTLWRLSMLTVWSPARYQIASNTAYRVSRQRYRSILQRALEIAIKCSK